MSDPRVRRQIALRAAQLMYAREEKEYFTAKRKAAKALGGSDRARDLPSNAEIREEILILAELMEGENRTRELRAMRVEALRFLRLLDHWRPRLIGSVWTGHIRAGSDIDIHVFGDHPAAIALALEDAGHPCRVECKRVLKHHEERVFTHIHIEGRYSVELTVYAADKANYPFRSSITGKTMERATAAELETLLRAEQPDSDLESELTCLEESMDQWDYYESLLRPLEHVRQSPKHHPEGDALYHTLQVFEFARRAREWDVEFLLAALLHDVGKAIDPEDHVTAGIEALRGRVTERTLWLMEHHMLAHEIREATIPFRSRRRIMAHPDFEELMLLEECDDAGRVPGAVVPNLDEVLAWLRTLNE